MGLKRIAIDWDFKSRLKIIFYLLRILKLDFKELTIKPSNNKGYHIIIWLKKGNKKKLRKYLGDDKKHLNLDYKHKHARQTLFYKKKSIRKIPVKI